MKDHMVHLKHVLIAGAVLLVLWALGWRGINAWKDVQANIRVRDVKVQENDATVKANAQALVPIQKTVAAAQASNTAGDAERDRKLNALQTQLNSKPDEAAIRAILQQELPKLHGVQLTTASDGTQMLSVPNTQENRDAINEQSVAFKSCRFSLDDCEAARKNLEQVIVPGLNQQLTILNGTIKAQQSTIELKDKDIHDLQRFGKGGNIWARTGRVAIPAGCGAAGATLAAQGGLKPKGIGIAALASAATCAVAFHF
jgi:hypothetical protein